MQGGLVSYILPWYISALFGTRSWLSDFGSGPPSISLNMPEGPCVRRWGDVARQFVGKEIEIVKGSSKVVDHNKWEGAYINAVVVYGKQLFFQLLKDISKSELSYETHVDKVNKENKEDEEGKNQGRKHATGVKNKGQKRGKNKREENPQEVETLLKGSGHKRRNIKKGEEMGEENSGCKRKKTQADKCKDETRLKDAAERTKRRKKCPDENKEELSDSVNETRCKQTKARKENEKEEIGEEQKDENDAERAGYEEGGSDEGQMQSVWFRYHFLMWGSLRANEYKEPSKRSKTGKVPNPMVEFHYADKTFLLFYGGSIRIVDGPCDDDGVDILSETFDMAKAVKAIRRPLPLCYTIMDQTCFAGAGNIVKNEVLYICRMHPLELGSSLSQDEALRVAEEVVRFTKAWQEWEKELSGYQRFGSWMKMYWKGRCADGHPTKRGWFGDELKRMTFWCPECQELRFQSDIARKELADIGKIKSSVKVKRNDSDVSGEEASPVDSKKGKGRKPKVSKQQPNQVVTNSRKKRKISRQANTAVQGDEIGANHVVDVQETPMSMKTEDCSDPISRIRHIRKGNANVPRVKRTKIKQENDVASGVRSDVKFQHVIQEVVSLSDDSADFKPEITVRRSARIKHKKQDC